MRISCRGLGASGLGRKLPTHGPLPETAAEFEPSEAHRIIESWLTKPGLITSLRFYFAFFRLDERYRDVSPTCPILQMSKVRRSATVSTRAKGTLLTAVARTLPQPQKHEGCRRGCSRIRTTCRIGSKGDRYQSIALADRRDH